MCIRSITLHLRCVCCCCVIPCYDLKWTKWLVGHSGAHWATWEKQKQLNMFRIGDLRVKGVYCWSVANFAHNICFVIVVEILNVSIIMNPPWDCNIFTNKHSLACLNVFSCLKCLVLFIIRNRFTVTPTINLKIPNHYYLSHCINRDMPFHNLICQWTVQPLGGKNLNVSEKPAHLSISFFLLSLSVSFFLTLFTHSLPSLMSARCTGSLSECTVSVLTPVPNYTCKWLITWTREGQQKLKSLLLDGSMIMSKFGTVSAAGNSRKGYLQWPESWEIKFWAPDVWTKDSPY